MDTERIIEQCAAGDRDAMAGLYRTYSPRMLRLIMRYVNDPAAAQDILHDGFIVILSHISEVRVPAKLEYWMGTIMKNLAIQYLSRIEVAELLEGEDELMDSPEMDDILTYDELEIIINKLPEGYRRIFKLAVFENKSHKEIGEMLGIAPHSSSSQLARAKAMLRRMIAERRAALGIGALLIVAATALIFTGRRFTESMPMAVAVEESIVTEAEVGAESVRAICDSISYYARNVAVVKPDVAAPRVAKSAESAGEAADSGSENTEAVTEAVGGPADNEIAEGETGVSSTDAAYNNMKADGQPDTGNVAAAVVDSTDEDMEPVAIKQRSSRSWSLGMNYDVRSLHLDNLSNNDDFVNNAPSNGEIDDPIDPDTPPGNIGSQSEESRTTDTRHSMPITVGVTLNHQLNRRLGIETGINFTYAHSEVTEKSGNRVTSERVVRTYYIGVPLKINFRIANIYPATFYGSGGIGIDIPVIHSDHATYGTEVHTDPRVQFSLSGGLGVEYRLSPTVSIYAEPSVKYYPDNGSSRSTFRSEHPWEVSVPVGIRFNW